MGASGSVMRSFRRDRDVTRASLPKGTTRRILRYARPHRKPIAAFIGLSVLSAAAGAAQPATIRALIDRGVTPGRDHVVLALAAVLAVLALTEAGLGLVMRWLGSQVGEGLIYDLRTQVFDHVQQMPVAFFVRAQTGSLVSRLNSDVIGAQAAITTTMSSVVANVVQVAVLVGYMVSLSPLVALGVLVVVPLFLLPARWTGRKLSVISRSAMENNAEMSGMMTERFNVSGATLVALFGRRAAESREFSRRADEVRRIGIRSAMYGRLFFVGLTAVAALATAVTYGVGGVLAAQGSLQIGTLVALVTVLGRVYGPITSLSNVQVDVLTAMVSFDRVFEVLDLEPMVRDRPGAVPLPAGARSVEFDDVSFRYPEPHEVSLASLESGSGGTPAPQPGVPPEPAREVLHGVSLRARPGELVALVGPSGAGKSTMTALATRLYDVTGGTVRIGGQDVRDVTLESLRAAIGVVTQESHLFHDTLRANLLYARPEATEDQVLDALRAAQLAELLADLPEGLDTVVGDRGHRLSGGEKQRVALARLLLKAPPIVVLDEATAHLDSASEAAVQRALETALQGRTSLVIAHRLSTVREADRIVVVDRGRVVQTGTHDQLLAAGGLYAELYRTQFAGQRVHTA